MRNRNIILISITLHGMEHNFFMENVFFRIGEANNFNKALNGLVLR